MPRGSIGRDLPFQSLKGFQPKWNVGDLTLLNTVKEGVSIPKRVSAKVERDGDGEGEGDPLGFNP